MRIETVQVLRFVAAGLVVLAHCASGYFLPGVAGVDIFFVISGLIITRVLGKRPPGDFALDRLTRIYPIYWLALLPMIPLDGVDLGRLLTSLTLWPYFGALNTPYLVVGWTLSYELLFYFAAMLVLWRRWMVGVLIGLFSLCMLMNKAHPLLGYVGNPIILEFLFGVLIARLPATRRRLPGAGALAIGFLALPLLAQARFGDSNLFFVPSFRPIVWGVPAAIIVWGALQWEGRFKGGVWPWLVLGGEASYALYLSHPTVLLAAPSDPYAKLLLMPPVCVLLSIIIHRWIERPITRASRRLVGLGGHERETTRAPGHAAD